MIIIGDHKRTLSSCHEAKYDKRVLCVHGRFGASDSIACIGASTARVGDSEICAFNAISVLSVQICGLFHVIAQALF